MKRRNFLIGGIAASAAVRTWPFRVYSFPSQIAIIDFEAEKARFVRLARIAIDEEVARGRIVAPFFFHEIAPAPLRTITKAPMSC